MLDATPFTVIAKPTFRDRAMYVGIPFQIASKGMQNADEPRGKELSFVYFMKHTYDNAAYGRKKAV